jgi:hypothetical protein
MKIIKKGNPDKIAKIKETREESRNPEIKCRYCDAQFRIQACDVRTREEGTQYYVRCPCCETDIVLCGADLPADYKKPIGYIDYKPTLNGVPGVFVVPSAPIAQPEKTWIGDPIESDVKVICTIDKKPIKKPINVFTKICKLPDYDDLEDE